ncbi:hypothetical protein Sgleb_53130 [Streptomyces glebosus]|uniref:Uncharacterized protein n=1 Tax=Streptomyces glebosus TaxID=249580 RepID=A0A640T4P7_9ACTN|nr:hypothetical protein Sgleb_53130 [Streptomyces glebosus]GHG80021.1 hypothetical protein GCM10010513_57710 [Streptomyces glebosus]
MRAANDPVNSAPKVISRPALSPLPPPPPPPVPPPSQPTPPPPNSPLSGIPEIGDGKSAGTVGERTGTRQEPAGRAGAPAAGNANRRSDIRMFRTGHPHSTGAAPYGTMSP